MAAEEERVWVIRPPDTTPPSKLDLRRYMLLEPDDVVAPGDEEWVNTQQWFDAFGENPVVVDTDKGVWLKRAKRGLVQDKIIRRKLDPITALGRLA